MTTFPKSKLKKRNDGSASEELFVERMQKRYGAKFFAHKLTDTKSAGKLVKSVPADYVVTLCGDMFWAEIKSSNNKTSFPLSCFQKPQLLGMKRQEMAGGDYIVYIHRLATNTWYCVHSTEIEHLSDGKKSINWDDLNFYKMDL